MGKSRRRRRKGANRNPKRQREEQPAGPFAKLAELRSQLRDSRSGPDRTDGGSANDARPGRTAPRERAAGRTRQRGKPFSELPPSLQAMFPQSGRHPEGQTGTPDIATSAMDSNERPWVGMPHWLDGRGDCPPALGDAQLSNPAARDALPLRELLIGLDFGTSSTKIAIRDLIDQRSRLCSFGVRGEDEAPCLLPTRVCVTEDGEFNLDRGFAFSTLKDRLLQDPKRPLQIQDAPLRVTPLELCTGYLGIALRLAISEYFEQRRAVLQEFVLVWSLHLGLPERNLSNVERLRAYRTLGLAAWNCAIGGDGLTLDRVREALREAEEDLQRFQRHPNAGPADPHHLGRIDPSDLSVFPEILAETAGYCVSDRARVGEMHVLLDIGATTVDVCIFMLDDGPPRGPLIQVSDVSALGPHQLHHRRLDVASYARSDQTRGFTRLPAEREYVMPALRAMRAETKRFLSELSDRYRGLLARAKQHQKNLAYWERAVPLLVYGGGSREELYRELLERIARPENARTFGLKEGYVRVPILNPGDLDHPTDCSADPLRYSVAYGLSLPVDLLKRYIPPPDEPPEDEGASEDPAGPRGPLPGPDRVFISKDMV